MWFIGEIWAYTTSPYVLSLTRVPQLICFGEQASKLLHTICGQAQFRIRAVDWRHDQTQDLVLCSEALLKYPAILDHHMQIVFKGIFLAGGLLLVGSSAILLLNVLMLNPG